MQRSFILIALFLIASTVAMQAQTNFDIEGHRGCRGLYPENTIIAFMEAVKLGVNTLEMDVVVSKDGKLVVSHDPTLNPDICSTSDGKPVSSGIRIYNLTYDEVKTFDCGSRGNPKFPEQKKMAAFKPLLSDVIDSVENYIQRNHLAAVHYNIETKSTPEGDDIEHPKPAVFSKMLYDLLKGKNVLSKCIIQSFDPRTLQVIHQIDSAMATALLVADIDSFEKNIHQLGYIPTIYSPNFVLVSEKMIKKCHLQNIKVIPWTVNDEDKMVKLKNMGVDGLITDYPDRAIKTLR
jgi:glycerophosphoryl diester phosphodiesterase